MRSGGPVSALRWPRPAGIRQIVRILGPGFITGASDDDPSGIGTYAVAGASLGLQTLWTALLTFPLMAAVQNICARVGMVSGRGLAGVLRRHYARPFLYGAVLLLFVANTVNVGADLAAVADAIRILNGVIAPPLLVLVMLAARNTRVMGQQTIGPALTILGWIATAGMFLALAGLAYTTLLART